MAARQIIHVDMDAFYAAVEVLDDPDLKGRCVIVGGSSNRGVVCSASYEARKMGVKSAQPMVTAKKMCPKAAIRPVRRSRYQEVSRQVFAVFERFTPCVEPLSVDEAFLDVTESQRLFGSGRRIGEEIRRMIRGEVGITASAGVAANKLTAKIASDLCKPDGLLVVEPEEIQAFLDPLPVSRLWGVGPKAVKKLQALGAKTIGDVRNLPADLLRAKFGKQGGLIHDFSHGRDPRPVESAAGAKSVGREITFERDVLSLEDAEKTLLMLSNEVARRMRKAGVRGRTVQLKVKYADFEQITRSLTLDRATDDAVEIFGRIKTLTGKTMVGRRPVRLLGVSLSGLDGPGRVWQPGLFDQEDSGEKRRRLHQAMDGICDRFGPAALMPAALAPEPNETKDGKTK